VRPIIAFVLTVVTIAALCNVLDRLQLCVVRRMNTSIEDQIWSWQYNNYGAPLPRWLTIAAERAGVSMEDTLSHVDPE